MTALSNKGGLTRFWDALKAIQNKIAAALTVVLLLILYFSIFAAVAIVARLFSKDLLHPEKTAPGSYWLSRQPVEHTLESFARQF